MSGTSAKATIIRCVRVTPGPHGGFTLLEVLIAFAIVGLIASVALPQYQRYTFRARAAGVAVEAQPIVRSIQDFHRAHATIQQRLRLVNGTDGAIAGCHAPEGSTCADAGATPVQVVVSPEKLLIASGTIRVSAAPCHVDCPDFALNFSSDLTVAGAWTPPVTPSGATPSVPAPGTAPVAPPTPPAASVPAPQPDPDPAGSSKGQGKGKGGGKGKSGSGDPQGTLQDPPGRRSLSWYDVSLVPSAHAALAAQAAGSSFERTNRVLYEFGEVMRGKAHAANNAGCLFNTGSCTVTIKY